MKNEAWVRIGSAVFAAMLCYFVLNIIANQMTQLLKIVIICAVASVALAIAFWGGKKTDQKTKQSKETSIGTDISAKGNVDVNNIRADTHPGEGVKIGSNITSEKDVRIQDIRVKSKGSNNG